MPFPYEGMWEADLYMEKASPSRIWEMMQAVGVLEATIRMYGVEA